MTTSSPIADGLPFTAHSLGLDRRQMQALRRSGGIRQLMRTVWLDVRAPETVLTRARAAKLVLRTDGVLALRSAAWVHGVDAFGRGARHQAHVVECFVPTDQPRMRRPGVRCHEATLLPGEVVEIDGLPVTTPTRTACDLLRYLPPPLALGSADALAHLGLTTRDEVVDALLPLKGFRHIRQARYLAPLIEPATESFGESGLRLRTIDAGFPRPVVQISLVDRNGVEVWRLDLGWPDVKLATEYDGAMDHTTSVDVAHDLTRRGDVARRFGYRVVPTTRDDVFGTSMDLEYRLGNLLGIEPVIGSRLW